MNFNKYLAQVQSLPEWVLWLISGLLLLVLCYVAFKPRFGYEKKSHLSSKAEQKLYKDLSKILPKNYFIHCQVSLISLLKPADLRSARMVWAKRMDYVITDKHTKILLVIELDDKSHERKDRKKRDKFVNKTLKGKHPLLRIPTANANDIAALKRNIQNLIEDG